MAKYGLIGEKLGHSFSPQIHSLLGNGEYSLIEIPKSEINDFFKKRDFCGINVTVPYKKIAFAACEHHSAAAAAVGSVNTVIKCADGSLYGDNTDIFGFEYLLDRAHIDVCRKKCLVFGNGGAAATVKSVLSGRGADVVTVCHADNNDARLAEHFDDTRIIINATPVGMFPHCGESPTELKKFGSLEAAADLIYNPRRTDFILEAESLGLRYSAGLPMLAAQAVRSDEIFFGRKSAPDTIDAIIEHIERMTANIVLIGMPGCGKTTVGGIIAKRTMRNFIDIDREIESASQKSIPEIFSESGESGFRTLESREIENHCGLQTGSVISTGGGAVTVDKNISVIRRSGVVFYIDKPILTLAVSGRPLSKPENLGRMYEERLPLYKKCADYTVTGATSAEIADKICEILSDIGL